MVVPTATTSSSTTTPIESETSSSLSNTDIKSVSPPPSSSTNVPPGVDNLSMVHTDVNMQSYSSGSPSISTPSETQPISEPALESTSTPVDSKTDSVTDTTPPPDLEGSHSTDSVAVPISTKDTTTQEKCSTSLTISDTIAPEMGSALESVSSEAQESGKPLQSDSPSLSNVPSKDSVAVLISTEDATAPEESATSLTICDTTAPEKGSTSDIISSEAQESSKLLQSDSPPSSSNVPSTSMEIQPGDIPLESSSEDQSIAPTETSDHGSNVSTTETPSDHGAAKIASTETQPISSPSSGQTCLSSQGSSVPIAEVNELSGDSISADVSIPVGQVTDNSSQSEVARQSDGDLSNQDKDQLVPNT